MYIAQIKGIIVKNVGAIYNDRVLSILNIDSEFTREWVIIEGISDLLL